MGAKKKSSGGGDVAPQAGKNKKSGNSNERIL